MVNSQLKKKSRKSRRRRKRKSHKKKLHFYEEIEALIEDKYGCRRAFQNWLFQPDLISTQVETLEWPLDSAQKNLSHSKMIYERNMRHFTRPKREEE